MIKIFSNKKKVEEEIYFLIYDVDIHDVEMVDIDHVVEMMLEHMLHSVVDIVVLMLVLIVHVVELVEKVVELEEQIHQIVIDRLMVVVVVDQDIENPLALD